MSARSAIGEASGCTVTVAGVLFWDSSNRFEEWNQKRIVHELIDDPAGLVKLRWGWCGWATCEAEQMISNVSGDVDLSRGARDDVNLHELLPERANTVIAVLGAVRVLNDEFVVEGSVALGVEGEFQAFHAMILGEVGHEGTEGPRRRSNIEENLAQRWGSGVHGGIWCGSS